LTQRGLAAKLGTTQSAIARWEKGAVSPRVDTLDRLLRACGFESRILLTRAPEPDLDQLAERLAWNPKQRLDYLRDMLAFEQRAHRARRATGRR
jgi:transcriptional regulator with XRE-family HTH domain